MRRWLRVLAAIALTAGPAGAAEIHVVSSGGFAAALKALIPLYERATGDRIVAEWGPSMGDTHDAVPQRLARGEALDVVVMVGPALDKLAAEGKAAPESRRRLARSVIGVAVKAGAPKPDISTPETLKTALLKAASIAYSDSASGVYIQNVMFKTLGIADEVRAKARMIPAEPVGKVVARGEAEIGFQQIAELKPVAGIDIVGPLPEALQLVTPYAAGIPATARDPEAGKRLIDFLASPQAAPAIAESGLEPP